MTLKGWVWLGIGVAAVGGTVAWTLQKQRADKAPPYRTAVVDKGDVTLSVSATGTLSAVTTVQVGSQVSGIIAQLYADFNSQVHKGQLLAELDPTPFEAQAEQRRADLRKAQVDASNDQVTYERQKKLVAQGLVAESEFDAARAAYMGAKAQVDQAQAALRQAETNLKYTKILSPIDGVVVDRQYDIGQTVAASFQAPTLFTIAQDMTKMQVQADVDQSDIGQVQVEQRARFNVDAYPEQEFRGRIAQVRLNATVNQNVITYPVIIEVANPEQKLRPKMTANVTVDVSTVRDVLRVPNAALRFRPAVSGDKEAGAPAVAAAGSSPARGGRGSRRSEGDAPASPGAAAAETPGAAAASASPSPTPAPSGIEEAAARAGERGRGFAGAARDFGMGGGGGRRKPKGEQTVYVVLPDQTLKPVAIRTGISDGRFTQVVSGELKPGDVVAVGLATVKVDEGASRAPRMGGPGRF